MKHNIGDVVFVVDGCLSYVALYLGEFETYKGYHHLSGSRAAKTTNIYTSKTKALAKVEENLERQLEDVKNGK